MESKSFEKIMSEYYEQIFNYCYSMIKNQYISQELCQEVFLNYYSKFSKEISPMYIKAYLYRTAHNMCITHLRRKKYSKLFRIQDQAETQESAENSVMNKCLSFHLERALNQLSDLQRSIVIMHAVEGLKHQEIAEILNKKESAIRKNYSRSINRIRKDMDEIKNKEETDDKSIFQIN